MHRPDRTVKCNRCLVSFCGDAICTECASGYCLEVLPVRLSDNPRHLVCVFRIGQVTDEKNRIRVNVDLARIETGIVVPKAELFDSNDNPVAINAHCTICNSGRLQFFDADTLPCPNCTNGVISAENNISL